VEVRNDTAELFYASWTTRWPLYETEAL
jgi:hypothetical protein